MHLLTLCPGEGGGVEEGVGLLESQCTFIWGENQKKKFLTSSPVEPLILFNEEHQSLLRKGTMEQVLVGGLLWLSGNSW